VSFSHRLVKLFIWAQVLLLSAVVVLGVLYALALLLASPFLLGLVQSPAQTFSAVVFSFIVILWIFGLILRTTVSIVFRKRTVGPDLRERLGKIGPETLQRMGLDLKVRFLVLKRSSSAYSGKNRILVGEKFLQQSTDDELRGIIGHEIGHVVKKDNTVRALWTLIPSITIGIALGLLISLSHGQVESALVPLMTGTGALLLSSIPLNWRIEYRADRFAAEHLGTDVIVRALSRLRTSHFDGFSFTHPPLSKRIRRLQQE
jgi:Zn-dependent protease with chaperone function